MISTPDRRASQKKGRPTETSKVPVDDDDPLSTSTSFTVPPSPPSPPASATALAVGRQNSDLLPNSLPAPAAVLSSSERSQSHEKDLAFLLDPSIYHPLSQIDILPPFRHPFLPPPAKSTSLESLLKQLDSLISDCDLLSAAEYARGILTSSSLSGFDVGNVFRLLGVRYACLELTGQTLLAANESKALSDLFSPFYYLGADVANEDSGRPDMSGRFLRHIMPFSLRLRSLRLQSIGFSDPRRGINSLYELAQEIREELTSNFTRGDRRKTLISELHEVGVAVVDFLIEMGDLDCAGRTLGNMHVHGTAPESLLLCKEALLYIRIGDLASAEKALNASEDVKDFFQPISAMAEGRYRDAVRLWQTQIESLRDSSLTGMLLQNLAVAYVYRGMLGEARGVFKQLSTEGRSFSGLITNMCTIFELTSEGARALKSSLAESVAVHHQQSGANQWVQNSTDFKI